MTLHKELQKTPKYQLDRFDEHVFHLTVYIQLLYYQKMCLNYNKKCFVLLSIYNKNEEKKVVYFLKTFQMSCFHLQQYECYMAALLEEVKFDIKKLWS